MAKKKITEAVEEVEVAEETGPSAEEKQAAKDAAKAAKAEAAAVKKAEKAAAAEAKKAAKEALRKNGELPPREGSKCATVWDTATQMSQELGSPVDGKSLLAALPEINHHTVKTQYARWRKHHGITGRITKPKTAEEQAAEKAAEEAKAEAAE